MDTREVAAQIDSVAPPEILTALIFTEILKCLWRENYFPVHERANLRAALSEVAFPASKSRIA